jgi:thioredoxin reductase (NADPH)
MTDADKDEQFYRDTESIAFPKLYDHQLSLLERNQSGKIRRVLREGQRRRGAGTR